MKPAKREAAVEFSIKLELERKGRRKKKPSPVHAPAIVKVYTSADYRRMKSAVLLDLCSTLNGLMATVGWRYRRWWWPFKVHYAVAHYRRSAFEYMGGEGWIFTEGHPRHPGTFQVAELVRQHRELDAAVGQLPEPSPTVGEVYARDRCCD